MEIHTTGESFKIVQFTDVHLSLPIQEIGLRAIQDVIEREAPDLLVFSGDLFHRYHNPADSIALIEQFNQHMEGLGVKYAFCFGNHDGELSLTKFQIFNQLIESKFCVGEVGDERYLRFHINDGQYKDPRIGNYKLDLYLNQVKCSELVMLDSGRYDNKGRDGSLTEEQVKLFPDLCSGNTPLLVFFHIPLEQFSTYYSTNRNSGLKREKICHQADESGLFELVSGLEREVYVSCGHDHLNDFELTIDQTKLIATPGMCFEEYNEQGVRGYRVFEIDASNGVNTYVKRYL